ncbi:hypothetical protein OEA_27270 (plasmid) [Priestia megaterium NCT-2]|nr:hypothetical protein OEA_27270 [Priestia megaterium NCT-2]
MPIRSIGMSLSNTSIQEEEQMSLFDDIRLRYGKNSVLRASSHLPHSTARYRNGLMGGHKA